MRKKAARPLIASLCLSLLLLATPPARATITGSLPLPATQKASAASERSERACNRPATDLPSPPNNCPEYEPVAPPSEPIPPACIASARYQETEMYGEPLIQLQIKVDHPELCGDGSCTGTIELTRYGYSLGTWELSDIRAGASCAKDEAPLAWATLQVLNTEQLDALDIYTAPLPSFYLDLLAELGGWPDGHSTTTLGSSTGSSTEGVSRPAKRTDCEP